MKIDVEKGTWFKIGIAIQNDADEYLLIVVTVNDIMIRIKLVNLNKKRATTAHSIRELQPWLFLTIFVFLLFYFLMVTHIATRICYFSAVIEKPPL